MFSVSASITQSGWLALFATGQFLKNCIVAFPIML